MQDIKSDNTKTLLKLIANHLSGRHDCRGIEYVLKIDDNGISFKPDIHVFPSRYNRKKSDKCGVLIHILSDHQSEFKSEEFCQGEYRYQISIDNKRRRWVNRYNYH